MAEKYLKIGTGGLPTEVEGKTTSVGLADAGKIPALDAAGKFDQTLMPAGIGQNVSILPSFENLAVGDWVNIFEDLGTVKVRKADNSNSRRAHGFVLAAVTAPASATVHGPGELNNQRSALTNGAEYLLGTAGGQTTTVPTAANTYVQPLGVAESATAIRFRPGTPIVRA